MFNRINLALVFAGLVTLLTSMAFAEPIKIILTEPDQRSLTKELSKIDLHHRSEEIIQENPFRIVRKKYEFLDKTEAFFIHCLEDFADFSVVSENAHCEIEFNSDLSQVGRIEIHDGFMPAFVIAEIKDPAIAKVLYESIGNGVGRNVFFSTEEELVFTHPSTGEKFYEPKIRIDCQRDDKYLNIGCSISAVK